MEKDLIKIQKRILDIAYKYKLSHLGSYFSSLEIMYEIFTKMSSKDIFILSSGHCALAYYCVLEHFKGICAESLFIKHGGHPHIDEDNFIYCSTGSLGLGVTVATGRATFNKERGVYCLISDGECAEGSVWESLKFIYENNIKNIKIYANINGYCAYDKVDGKYLSDRLISFLPNINIRYTTVEKFPFLNGLNAHYHIMKENDYKLALEILDRD
jgi:transketolase